MTSCRRPPPRLLFVKFFGGLLAIGSGLALGREGPSVQMGAAIAHVVGKLFRRNWHDCKVLIAAGAGAGLATAFNAPIAGAVFVLEELMRRFETRTAIAALGASAAAIAVARALLGPDPDFYCRAASLSRGANLASIRRAGCRSRARRDTLQLRIAADALRDGSARPLAYRISRRRHRGSGRRAGLLRAGAYRRRR